MMDVVSMMEGKLGYMMVCMIQKLMGCKLMAKRENKKL